MDPFVVSIQKEKWNGKWERSGFSQLSFSQSHLELELDLTVKNGEHTSQPTRRRDRARRTGFSSSFTYSRVAPNLFLSLRQRNLLFLVCVSIQGVIAWKETTPQCRFVALTFCFKKKKKNCLFECIFKDRDTSENVEFLNIGSRRIDRISLLLSDELVQRICWCEQGCSRFLIGGGRNNKKTKTCWITDCSFHTDYIFI